MQVQEYAEKCKELEAELQCLAEGSGLISPQHSSSVHILGAPGSEELRKQVFELEQQLMQVQLNGQKAREQHHSELKAAIERAEEQQQKWVFIINK